MAVTTSGFSFQSGDMDAFQYDGVNVTQQDLIDWLNENLDMETHFVQPNGNTVYFGQNGGVPWYAWTSCWICTREDGYPFVMDNAVIQAFYGPSIT